MVGSQFDSRRLRSNYQRRSRKEINAEDSKFHLRKRPQTKAIIRKASTDGHFEQVVKRDRGGF